MIQNCIQYICNMFNTIINNRAENELIVEKVKLVNKTDDTIVINLHQMNEMNEMTNEYFHIDVEPLSIEEAYQENNTSNNDTIHRSYWNTLCLRNYTYCINRNIDLIFLFILPVICVYSIIVCLCDKINDFYQKTKSKN